MCMQLHGHPCGCAADASESLKQVVIVQLVIVLHDLALDLARVSPRDKVLHVASHEEGWVGDSVRANTHMALLYERARLTQVLTHL